MTRATRATRGSGRSTLSAGLVWVAAASTCTPARRRLLLAAAVAGGLLLEVAAPAHALTAATPAAVGAGAPQALSADAPAPTNPWLTFFEPKDSHGLSPWRYELSVDQGGVRDTSKAVAYFFASQIWMTYRFVVVAVLWLLDFVLQFKQLDLLKVPAETLGTTLQSVTGQLGVVPMMIAVSVLMSGFWLVRGRSGAAFGEIFTTAVIAALIGGVLANPVGVLTGPDGALPAARDFGVQISSQLVGGAAYAGTGASVPAPKTTDELRQGIDAKILDNLVRTPHQLVNYGQVLDKTKSADCIAVYDKTVGVTDDAGRNTISDACGEDTLKASDNTLAVQLGVMVVSTAGIFFFLLVLALALALLLATALALWEAAKLVVVLILSLIPGSSRAAVLVTLCTIAVAVAMCAVILAAVGLLMLCLDTVFTVTASWPPVTIFLIVDLLLAGGAIAALVMALKVKRSGRKLGERASKALQPRPGSLPKGGGLVPAVRQLAQPVMQARQSATLRAALNPSAGPGVPGRPSLATVSAAGAARGSSASTSSTGTGTRPRGVVRSAGAAAWTVGKIGLASTVGAPVYAPRAAAAAQKLATARKVAVAAKLRSRGDAVTARVDKARTDATAFKDEYVHNVSTAGRAIARATGLPKLLKAADPGRPAPMNGPAGTNTSTDTSTVGDGGSSATAVDDAPAQRTGPDWAHRQMKLSPLPTMQPGTGRKKPPPPPAAVAYSAAAPAPRPTQARAPTPSTAATPPAPPAAPPSPISYPQSGADKLRARLQQRKP